MLLDEATHDFHVILGVGEELFVALAKAVESIFAFGCGGESVLGTFAVTEEQPAAVATDTW